MHSLLRRQLQRYLGFEQIEAAPREWRDFLQAVDQAYDVQQRTQVEEELPVASQGLKDPQAQLLQAEKLAAIGRFASGVAHEVKNPLQIIVQGVEYLKGELGSNHAGIADIIQTVREAVFRADRIVRALVEFSRSSSLELKPIVLVEVVATALQLIEQQLIRSKVQVELKVPDTLPRLMLDGNQITQVFLNVMLNAIQAMPSGGTLTIRASTTHLTEAQVSFKRGAEALKDGQAVVVCEIQDTGVGVPPEHLHRLFEPFFTTKPPGQGTGLGLAITRSIMEHHKGLIEVESAPRRGTTVRLVFPIPNETTADQLGVLR